MNLHLKKLLPLVVLTLCLAGCKYYGGALPPEHPISMDNALRQTNNYGGQVDAKGNPIPPPPRPALNRPSYLPEKELAVVAPPKTLLVWTYAHVTDDNTRVFGSWSTIFLTDRYQWVLPANEQSTMGGGGDGQGN